MLISIIIQFSILIVLLLIFWKLCKATKNTRQAPPAISREPATPIAETKIKPPRVIYLSEEHEKKIAGVNNTPEAW